MTIKKKEEYEICCDFQLMGRSCKNQEIGCLGGHSIQSRFCEFHMREERLSECDIYLTPSDIHSD